jgi:hypothetical protein
MVCEWTDGREPKDGTKESWAVLETVNLGDDLYHGDAQFDTGRIDPILNF